MTRGDDRVAPITPLRNSSSRQPRAVLVRLCIVAIVGLLATGGLLAWAIRPHGVYWSEAQLRFVSPTYPSVPNSLQTSDVSLIMVAGAVGQMIDDARHPSTASDRVSIADRGVRSGWSVNLLNAGGQWVTYYTDPILDVQAAGSTAQGVLSTMHRLILAVGADLVALQNKAGVTPPNAIHARLLESAGPQIYYEGGSRIRAVGSSLIIGFLLTMTAMWVLPIRSKSSHGATGVPSV